MVEKNDVQGKNKLLSFLPPDEIDRLEPHLEDFALEFKFVIYETGGMIADLYFPRSGVISLVTVMQNGDQLEIATVGNEGMVGLPVFLGSNTSPIRTICQIPGRAWRIDANLFREHINQPKLHDILNRYSQALFTQVAQGNACNNAHNIQQRCARWLLTTHDRVDSDEFPLTQEFLSQMLGTRRASVNEASARFQQSGMITYKQGRIKILNRSALEATSCECYHTIKNEYERLLD